MHESLFGHQLLQDRNRVGHGSITSRVLIARLTYCDRDGFSYPRAEAPREDFRKFCNCLDGAELVIRRRVRARFAPQDDDSKFEACVLCFVFCVLESSTLPLGLFNPGS